MGKLSEILSGSGGKFENLWDKTEAAGEYGLLPRGVYSCHAIKGELIKSRSKETPGYQIEFSIIEGERTGRKLWLDCWLTPAALPQTKRDLAKLGITSLEQLEQPLPRWYRCAVTVVCRKDDDGIERNKVKTFEVLRLDKPEADPFAPPDETDADQAEDISFHPDAF